MKFRKKKWTGEEKKVWKFMNSLIWTKLGPNLIKPHYKSVWMAPVSMSLLPIRTQLEIGSVKIEL